MSFRNERFNRSCLSLEKLAESIDPAKSRSFSDKGAGAERIFRDVDHEEEQQAMSETELENTRVEMTLLGKWLLDVCGKDRLIPVVEQIEKNGSDRQKSIRNLAIQRHVKRRVAERFYDRGVRALMAFFSPNEIKGETHFEKSVCL